jgi:aryl-alcohol dehydrogenase-like predicted oxidoreductase
MNLQSIDIGDVKVSAIGQGCMGIGGCFTTDRSRDSEQIAALVLGIDLGMTFIDTAEGYGGGHSEELVGEAVAGRRESVFLASKVSPEHLSADALTFACENSLRRLKTDRIDLYQIHWPNPVVPLEETLGGLVRLREQGKIRHIGVSNFSLQETLRARFILGSTPLFSVQTEYNLFERSPEEDIIPWCADEGVLFIAYSPLDQGRLVGIAAVRRNLAKFAQIIGCTQSQLVLAFLRSQGPVLPIPKALRDVHIRENAGASEVVLSADIKRQMDSECRIEMKLVPWRHIRPASDTSGDHVVYKSIEEARANFARHSPSPMDLAMEIVRNNDIKPIRVTPVLGGDGTFRYDLAEGRIRFWAWVLAFNGTRDVPVLVRD